MLKALVTLLAVSALTAAAASAAPGASGPLPPHTIVGMGEQNPEMFEDARFHATGIRHARLLVPYDVVKRGGWPLAVADMWLARAHRDGIEPLVSFGHSMSKRRQFRLPS